MSEIDSLPDPITNHEVQAALLQLEQSIMRALDGNPWKISALGVSWVISKGEEHYASAVLTGDKSGHSLEFMADAIAGREEFEGETEDVSALFRRN